MSLNNILQYFVPKDRKFFPLFENGSANLVEIAQVLVKLLNSTDEGEKQELTKIIEDLEHKGDEITHQIYLELGKNFITPFDREDIHLLATVVDDIADFIHGSSTRIQLYKIHDITPAMKELGNLILQGCQDLDKAILELKNLRNLRLIAESCVRINSMENQAGRRRV